MTTCVLAGRDAAQSQKKLFNWLDAVALTINLQHSFVYDHDNVRVPGCFQHLPPEEGSSFRSLLSAKCVVRQRETKAGALLWPLSGSWQWSGVGEGGIVYYFNSNWTIYGAIKGAFCVHKPSALMTSYHYSSDFFAIDQIHI